MNAEKSRLDWLRMFKELTDPDLKSEAARKRAILKRKEEKMADTGYDA